MTETGIGARVKRKEDQRFITGKGRYTDDINLKGQTYAYFVRSPHAHATIKSINTAKAAKMPGVVGVFTSKDVAEDKIGGLICGWDHSDAHRWRGARSAQARCAMSATMSRW
jgi:carbon-monoxide dehydrogenase large subunit